MKEPDWKHFVEILYKKNKDVETDQTDYVLVYKNDGNSEAETARNKFFECLAKLGVSCKESEFQNFFFVELHAPLHLLFEEGDRAGLQIPAYLPSGYEESVKRSFVFSSFFKYFSSESFIDLLSVPLRKDTHKMWANSDRPSNVFRTATRSLLMYCILNAVDVYEDPAAEVDLTEPPETERSLSTKEGLNHMLMKKYFIDAFPLHDRVKERKDNSHEFIVEGNPPESRQAAYKFYSGINMGANVDSKTELYKAWMKFYKFQPINMIRDYFGEKIGLYFAWCDVLIFSMWIPMLFGVATFIYGLVLNNSTVSSIDLVTESFDNDLMPAYSVIITLWGTIFLELWKRKNATLAYMWDVDSFEDNEPDRPQYSEKKTCFKSGGWLNGICVKYSVSAITILFMVSLVCIITAALILYRVVMTVDYCSYAPSANCLIVSIIITSVLNSIGIIILNKVYHWVALKLTDWENYRTQTEYDDALILKLFAFEFTNSYTSCFYIAFFRGLRFNGGIFGIGRQYNDSCGVKSCMPMLSFQILTLMLLKPLPKLISDLILPILKRMFKKYSNKVRSHSQSTLCNEDENHQTPSFIEEDFLKVPPGDFTLSEYTEKVILYGYLMLFAASFPLAPLITLITLLVDTRLDGHRLLFLTRRPVAFICEDIGRWYDILNFINVLGVLVNACLIAYTSQFGMNYSSYEKLMIVLIFENVLFALKYVIAIIIPDEPASIKEAKRKDVFKYEKLLADANKNPQGKKTNLSARATSTYLEDNEFPDDQRTNN